MLEIEKSMLSFKNKTKIECKLVNKKKPPNILYTHATLLQFHQKYQQQQQKIVQQL